MSFSRVSGISFPFYLQRENKEVAFREGNGFRRTCMRMRSRDL